MITYDHKVEYVSSIEELDTAFYNMLLGCTIDGKLVPARFVQPDPTYVEQVYPIFNFYRATPFNDNERWINDYIVDNPIYDSSGSLVSYDKRKYPQPMSMIYTIRTSYDNQIHGMEMNNYLSTTFNRDTVLMIKDIVYDVDFIGGRVFGTEYKNYGKLKGGEKREFSEIYNYRVNFLRDIYPRETIPVAKGINTNMQKL